MDRFEQAYASDRLTKPRQAVAAAAAHHRLLWIHPFLDGNGRVTRLMSHAMLQELGVGSALWSISRGLARRSADYKRLLMAADEPRKCVHRPMTDGIPDGWRTAFRWHGGQCSGMMPDSSG
ncbi:MAG: Fic family protein [Dehalococcoidia bacterium]|nr:Fic family protein [Dehalococcoidia bacterium]